MKVCRYTVAIEIRQVPCRVFNPVECSKLNSPPPPQPVRVWAGEPPGSFPLKTLVGAGFWLSIRRREFPWVLN